MEATYLDRILTRGLSGVIERIARADTPDAPIVVTGYASTVDEDIDGYVIAPEAYRDGLSLYMRNPILLFNHDRDKPIGIVRRADIDSRGLLIEAEFDMADDFAAAKARQAERGVLRGFSVGFRPTAEPKFKDEKLYFGRVQLMEISLVSVPANPHALIGAEAGELVSRAAAECQANALKEIAAAESRSREAIDVYFKEALKGAELRIAELFEARGLTLANLISQVEKKRAAPVEDDFIGHVLCDVVRIGANPPLEDGAGSGSGSKGGGPILPSISLAPLPPVIAGGE